MVCFPFPLSPSLFPLLYPSETNYSQPHTDRTVSSAGDFSYTDLDGSVSPNQGLYVKFDDGSRIVVRLSGTGSSGATIRLYIEKHSGDESTYGQDAQVFLKNDVEFAVELLKFKEYIGRTEPDVKT